MQADINLASLFLLVRIPRTKSWRFFSNIPRRLHSYNRTRITGEADWLTRWHWAVLVLPAEYLFVTNQSGPQVRDYPGVMCHHLHKMILLLGNKYFAAVINHARLIFPTIVHAYESLNISRKLLECQVMPKYGHTSALRTFIWTNQR